MATVAAGARTNGTRRDRLQGVDLARSLALLAMLTTHTIISPENATERVLWFAKGPTAPLFVMLAGTGLALATGVQRRPGSLALVAVRATALLLIGLWLETQMEGSILQYYALYFLLGIGVVRLPSRALHVIAALCVVGGPLLLTALLRAGWTEGHSAADEGLGSLGRPVALLRALGLEGAYPAAVWMGFFVTGIALGRLHLSSAGVARKLLVGGSLAAAAAYAVTWWGNRTFAPQDVSLFEGLKSERPEWSFHWTTYGHSEALAWAVVSTAFGIAALGGCLLLARRWAGNRLLGPPVALGRMPLTYYLLHLWYVDTLWTRFDPHLGNPVAYVAATLAFWILFALAAQQWLRRFSRGPLESLLHAVAVLVVRPGSRGPVEPAPSAVV